MLTCTIYMCSECILDVQLYRFIRYLLDDYSTPPPPQKKTILQQRLNWLGFFFTNMVIWNKDNHVRSFTDAKFYLIFLDVLSLIYEKWVQSYQKNRTVGQKKNKFIWQQNIYRNITFAFNLLISSVYQKCMVLRKFESLIP